jgi:type II secretory pathway pseudopilin PulG
MKRPVGGGYTLVEVMIFLAISSLLFVAAMVTVNGQQAKTQFAQAMRDADSKIQRVINDVYAGFYPSYSNINCSAGGSSLSFSSGTTGQGANRECISLGKVFHFGPNDASVSPNQDGYFIYALAGRRTVAGSPLPGTPVSNLAEATPAAVYNATAGLDLTEKSPLGWGLQVTRVGLYTPGNPGSIASDVSLVGFITSFNQFNPGTSDLVSGSQTVDLVTAAGNGVNQTQSFGVAQVPNLSTSAAPNGVVVCFRAIRSGQRAAILIGADNSRLTTQLKLEPAQVPTGCP